MIDVDHGGPRAFTRQHDANIDSHANSQRDGSRNKRTVEIDDLSLALTVQGFRNALSLNCNLQANSRASSALTSKVRGHVAPAYASLVRKKQNAQNSFESWDALLNSPPPSTAHRQTRC